MELINNLIQQVNGDQLGGGYHSLDLINRPSGPGRVITPNRQRIFKKFNHRFRQRQSQSV